MPTNHSSSNFTELAKQWKTETALLSNMAKKTSHPAYQRIICMGEPAVPLMLKELEKSPTHWFIALRTITGDNPVKPENRGRILLMAQDWLKWGYAHGYKRH